MSRVGNLRGAPLFLRPSVVRGLVEGVDAIRKGLVQVPVAPIKLVDVPRRSEDPRLAKANDDTIQVSGPSGWAAPTAASEPEDWPDAPMPEHADPDLDRPEPAEFDAADLIPSSTIGNGIALKRAPKIDLDRLVRAHRAKAAHPPKKNHRPLTPAPSREECPRCGIPGSKGCAHFLPCLDMAPTAPIEASDLRRVTKFSGRRQGKSVLRIR